MIMNDIFKKRTAFVLVFIGIFMFSSLYSDDGLLSDIKINSSDNELKITIITDIDKLEYNETKSENGISLSLRDCIHSAVVKDMKLNFGFIKGVKIRQNNNDMIVDFLTDENVPGYVTMGASNKVLVVFNDSDDLAMTNMEMSLRNLNQMMLGIQEDNKSETKNEQNIINADRKISLNLEKADIRTVIRTFAEVSGENIVVSKEVEGDITINIKNVPWYEAFTMVLKLVKAIPVKEGNIIRVVSEEEYNSEIIKREEAKKKIEQLKPLETAFFTLKYGKASDLVSVIEKNLERGSVASDERTNTLIVKEVPSLIEKIKFIVENLDRQTKQINISAKIIEVSDDASLNLGILWGAGVADTVAGSQSALMTVEFDDGLSDRLTTGSFEPKVNLDAALAALETEGKVKTLSTPNVTVVDNGTANINAGDNIPYNKRSETGEWEIDFVKTGVLLTVNPVINAEDVITLSLEASVSSVRAASSGINADYNIVEKAAETVVMVKNGKTVVVGGLTTEDESYVKSRLPFLGHIPLLGELLFTQTITQKNQKEIIMFVTPTIVEAATGSLKN